MTLSIRPEAPEDHEAVDDVVQQAFGQPDEARIVEALRGTDSFVLSLVAEEDGEVVGHVLFSRARLEDAQTSRAVLLLAPLAVRPDRQLRGIGSALVRAGLEAARVAGEALVLVVGSSDYYPRLGFEQGSERGIQNPFPGVPEEDFMALGLSEGSRGWSGGGPVPPGVRRLKGRTTVPRLGSEARTWLSW